MDDQEIKASIFAGAAQAAFRQPLGALDSNFLAQPVSALPLHDPICVNETTPIHEVMMLLNRHRFGCVLVVNDKDKLTGIFSERDYVLKVYGQDLDVKSAPVSSVMTRDPMTQPPDASLAHLLSLMSHGGFRHLPIVQPDSSPIWVVSVKDIVDHVMAGISDALLNFETLLTD